MRECPCCGTQLSCHRQNELESEIPAQLKQARELIKKGKIKEAKQIINDASGKNRQFELPGIEEEIRVLYKKLKEIKFKTKQANKIAAWAA